MWQGQKWHPAKAHLIEKSTTKTQSRNSWQPTKRGRHERKLFATLAHVSRTTKLQAARTPDHHNQESWNTRQKNYGINKIETWYIYNIISLQQTLFHTTPPEQFVMLPKLRGRSLESYDCKYNNTTSVPASHNIKARGTAKWSCTCTQRYSTINNKSRNIVNPIAWVEPPYQTIYEASLLPNDGTKRITRYLEHEHVRPNCLLQNNERFQHMKTATSYQTIKDAT